MKAHPSIIWEGSFFVNHSLANVNREIVLALLDQGIEVGCIPYEMHKFSHEAEPRFARIQERFFSFPLRPVAHIRHLYPPKFDPPARGSSILMQPWEYGSLPVEWKEGAEKVSEVWAYSRYVKEMYERAGVSPEKVQIIPLGVNPDQFCPGGERFDLPTKKKFRFLFVGGLIGRKGADLLVKAYLSEFRRDEDVTLVLKDFFYPSEIVEQLRKLATRRDLPEMIHIQGDVLPAELPGFYSACSCYVQPYRGEGFGLPVLEAMACGLPAITTRYGSALDFCSPENAYLIPATIEVSPEKKIKHYETCDYPFWAEPDMSLLRKTMRWVFEHRRGALERGLAASCEVRHSWSWRAAAQKIKERILALYGQTPSEHEHGSGVGLTASGVPSPSTIASGGLTPSLLSSSDLAAQHNFLVPLHKAESFLSLGGYGKSAAEGAQLLLDSSPIEAGPYATLLRGTVLALLGRKEEAGRLLQGTTERFPSLADHEQIMAIRLALISGEAGDREGKILLKILPSLSSQNSSPFHLLRVAELLVSFAALKEAREVLETLPSAVLSLPASRYLLARICQGEEKVREACALLEENTEEFPFHAPSWLLLSEMYHDDALSRAAYLEAVRGHAFLE